MKRWVGKTAVVTGASDGIGAAIAVKLADSGLTVIGLARRAHLIEELKSKVQGEGSIVARACDVSKPQRVTETFQWIQESFGAIHTVINNAGVFAYGQITDIGDTQVSEDSLLSIIDTNIKGTVMCARLAASSMKKYNFDGHIINISSLAGHYMPFMPMFNMYPSTKHAVTTFSQALINELAHLESHIKVTNLSPGLVQTGMVGSFKGLPILQPSDVADIVVYLLSTPPHVNITELTFGPVGEKRL